MSENNEDLSYLGEDELLSVDSPFATGASGYVEEQVDLWVQEARTRHENLINKYNNVIYRTAVAENSVNELTLELETAKNDVTVSHERINELEENLQSYVAALEASNADAASLREELEASRASLPVEDTAPVADENKADENEVVVNQLQEQVRFLQNALDEKENTVYALKQELENAKSEVEAAKNLADEYMAAPAVEETVVTASTKAQRILEAAAEEASEHVSRAIDRVQLIEDEANAEAATIREDALTEAEEIKATALSDAADAVTQFENAKAATKELFERVRSFHEYQLENITSIFNLDEEKEVTETLRENPDEILVGEVREGEASFETATEDEPSVEETSDTDYSYQTPTESIEVIENEESVQDDSDTFNDYQETTLDEESEDTDETRY